MESSLNVDRILPLKIGLSGRIYEKDEIVNIMGEVMNKLTELTYTIFYFFDEKIFTYIKNQHLTKQCVLVQQNDPPTDFIITFGGDGTILYTASKFQENTPPFLSFQKGTLGFLCKFSLLQIEQVLENMMHSRKTAVDDDFPFQIDKHMRIQGILKSEQRTEICLNEITISRHSSAKIVLQIYVNNQFLTETAGDGLLVSTPTGSTAYALSAGGPIMQNGVNSIIIVPIAPHSLSFRPICLPASSTIKLKFSQKSRHAQGLISFDGQSESIFRAQNQIIIRKSDSDITFYEPKQNEKQLPSWMKRLKIFLGWNQSFKSSQKSEDEQNQYQQKNSFIRRKNYKPKI